MNGDFLFLSATAYGTVDFTCFLFWSACMRESARNDHIRTVGNGNEKARGVNLFLRRL